LPLSLLLSSFLFLYLFLCKYPITTVQFLHLSIWTNQGP
jgi:hypothetical protein